MVLPSGDEDPKGVKGIKRGSSSECHNKRKTLEISESNLEEWKWLDTYDGIKENIIEASIGVEK